MPGRFGIVLTFYSMLNHCHCDQDRSQLEPFLGDAQLRKAEAADTFFAAAYSEQVLKKAGAFSLGSYASSRLEDLHVVMHIYST